MADPAQGVAGAGGAAGHFLNELSVPLGLEAVCLDSITVAPHLNARYAKSSSKINQDLVDAPCNRVK